MDRSTYNDAAFIDVVPHDFRKSSTYSDKIPINELESIYWQTLGWVHTPNFKRVSLLLDSTVSIPRPALLSEERLYEKHSSDPKLQVEKKVPYGSFTKAVAVDIAKRQFRKQNFEKLLLEMGLSSEVIRPTTVCCSDRIIVVKTDVVEGIPPEPFLNLEDFADEFSYETRSPAEWLLLGKSDTGQKPIPGAALLPTDDDDILALSYLKWQKVAVFDYNFERKLYKVKKEHDLRIKASSDEDSLFDYWIPRIYLKFDGEDPLRFVESLFSAVRTRHLVEESIRLSYYVDCMPLQGAPRWTDEDLNEIVGIVRQNKILGAKLQWIKDELKINMEELQVEYQRAYNYLTYAEITGQKPCLMSDLKCNMITPVGQKQNQCRFLEQSYSFGERLEIFRTKTLYTQTEVIRAKCIVETHMLALSSMSIYSLPLGDVIPLDNFEQLQTKALKSIEVYINEKWLLEIAKGITSSLQNCNKGSYDLNQKMRHTFQFSKLGRFLRMCMFKMQDVIRFLITDSLCSYAAIFEEACYRLKDVTEGYEWRDSFTTNKFSPLKLPIFFTPLEIKGEHLVFSRDLQSYLDVAMALFDKGLRITQDLPRLEKFIMKKMLYNPDDKLETVNEKEIQVVRWRGMIENGMKKAIIAANAYAHSYDKALKLFKTDQINYVKNFVRTKASCEHLKSVIEMHHSEKEKLAERIPAFVDIGPFRLGTMAVRIAAVKKHEILADAVLGHFNEKLRNQMDSIHDNFLVLLDRIEQPTGNIEDLIEKKKWCRTVPQKTEKLSSEINRLRADCKVFATFHLNMENEDFAMFWKVQALPQKAMKALNNRLGSFDSERNEHKEHLAVDQKKFKDNLKQLHGSIQLISKKKFIKDASQIAINVRKARKELNDCKERAELYNKRERLFGFDPTDYSEVEDLSKTLRPYEQFWLSTAEFQKYREMDKTDKIETSQLREAIKEFRGNLRSCEDYFKEKNSTLFAAVQTVLAEINDFVRSRK
ncbi:dynein axonemal heavy chain 1-like [Uloborus diversus]|uniref:dynein axonemal heavy chain 1-like n=1 Tax=Uloborus diversus TaxID=327109 RepID=UPI002408FD15|nr:dynein axonemal heavy chain 1-like [Uloborus diversus]